MGTLVEDKRKALLKARLEKGDQPKILKPTKQKELPIETVIDMSCL